MMTESEENDALARWLKGEMKDTDLESAISPGDFKTYKAIINEIDTWELDDDGIGVEDIDDVIAKLKQSKEAKVVPINTYRRIMSIAAAVTLLLGAIIYWKLFLDTIKVYETGTGELATITLPDGNSMIHLASNSSVTYDESGWMDNRQVEMNGRAYFIAEKGNKFTVNFTSGLVEVLGTRFEINSNKSIVGIKCFEGVIKAINTSDGETKVLKKNESVMSNAVGEWEKVNIQENQPGWLNGNNSFSNVPLFHVINILESTYGITVVPNDVDLNQIFTGSFPTNDAELSFEVVFQPFGINYEVNGSEVRLSQ